MGGDAWLWILVASLQATPEVLLLLSGGRVMRVPRLHSGGGLAVWREGGGLGIEQT